MNIDEWLKFLDESERKAKEHWGGGEELETALGKIEYARGILELMKEEGK